VRVPPVSPSNGRVVQGAQLRRKRAANYSALLCDRAENSAGICSPLSADSTKRNFTANTSQRVNTFCDTLRSANGIIRRALIVYLIATLHFVMSLVKWQVNLLTPY
jgi:hypothetical protein